MFEIFSNTKTFESPWIGNKTFVSMGGHKLRLKLVQMARNVRAFLHSTNGDHTKIVNDLRRDGYVAIENFLPESEFKALREEAHNTASKAAETHPPLEGEREGFQDKEDRPFGFDRYDGNTLNRFVNLNKAEHPLAQAFANDPRLTALTVAITGTSFKPHKCWLYETYHGDNTGIEDPQKTFHRDTFFPSMKFWYFIDPVTPKDGPFEYVPGSHKLTKDRLKWENALAIKACDPECAELDDETKAGSFRISNVELAALGLKPKALSVPANTLVIADTFGFHRRSDADAGRKRLSLYGNERTKAFNIFKR